MQIGIRPLCRTTGPVTWAGDKLLDSSGKYIYMPELRRMDALRPLVLPELPAVITVVTTPLKLEA